MKKKTIIICMISLLIVLLGIGGLFYFYSQKKDTELPEIEKVKLEVKEEITLDYGSKIPKFNDFCTYDKEEKVKVEIYFDDELYEEDTLNELGEYKVKIIVEDKVYDSKLIVVDRESPLLEVKNVEIKENEKYDIKDFILKCEDNTNKECLLEYEKDEMSSFTKAGNYDINIIAKDESDNKVVGEAKLVIIKKEEEKTSSSNPKKNNNANSSNKNDTSNNGPEVVTYKYGVKIVTKGSKVTYDRTTFNATVNDLKAEALEQKSKESANINQILVETNKYRAEKGLSPLILDDTMTMAANIRALEMAWGDKLSHTRPDGRSCFTIFDDVGFTSYYSGENIAWGQKNGTSAVTWWRNSPGHYANMINENYTKIGIGVYKFDGKYYYAQLFSS